MNTQYLFSTLLQRLNDFIVEVEAPNKITVTNHIDDMVVLHLNNPSPYFVLMGSTKYDLYDNADLNSLISNIEKILGWAVKL